MKVKLSTIFVLSLLFFVLFSCEYRREAQILLTQPKENQGKEINGTKKEIQEDYEIKLISPRNGASDVPEEGVELSWKAYVKGTTREATQLIFQVCFSTETPPRTIIKDNSGKDFFPTNRIQIGNLKPGTTYYWQIIAKDSEGRLFESEIWSFKTKKIDTPKLILISPVNGASSVPIRNVTFSWQVETAGQKRLIYDFLISKSESFSDVLFKAKTNLSSFTLDQKLDKSTKYFWKVIAKAETGETFESSVSSFVTINPTPPKFLNMEPGNNSEKIPVEKVRFRWDFSDEDGDELKYEFYLYEDTTEGTPLVVLTSLGTNTLLLEQQKLDYGKSYYWKVLAKDQDGSVTSSPIYKFNTISEEQAKVEEERKRFPEIVEIDPKNDGVISRERRISWRYSQEVSKDFSVELILATDPAATPKIIPLSTETTEYVVPEDILRKGQTYYWKLRFTTKDGKEHVTEWFRFSTLKPTIPTPPVPVEPKNGTEVKPGKLVLKWSESTDEDGDLLVYDVLIGTSPEQLIAVKTGIRETRLEISDLEKGKQYYWKVITKDHDGNKVESELVSFRTSLLGDLVVITPKNKESNIPVKGIKFEWIDESHETVTYTLRLGKSEDKMAIVSLEQKENYYILDKKLNYGTTYYWRVDRTYNGQVYKGEIYQFTTVGLPKPEKMNPTGLNVPTKNVVLSWEYPLLEAESITFEIYIGPVPTDLKKVAENLKEPSFTIPFRLEKERTYYWKVVVRNAYGVTSESDVASFQTIPPTQPSKPKDPQPQNGSENVDFENVKLSWRCVDLDGDTLRYNIYLDTVNPPQKLISGIKNNEFSAGKLTPNTTYYWQVVAVDEDGYESVGDVWTFKTGRIYLLEDFESDKYSLPNVRTKGIVRIVNEPSKGRVLELKASHNGFSEFSFTVEVVSRMVMKFDYLISSEENGDFFVLYVNEKELFRDSGERSWRTFETVLGPGKHNVRFTYEKDGIRSSGKDCLLIDNIVLKLGM